MVTDRREDVMAARAAALARPVADEETHDSVEVVTLEVSGAANFAIEARHVREVMRNDHLRRLPGGAGALLGVVPSRGEVVPVADLGALLGLCPPSRSRAMVVVLDHETAPLGLLVDGVEEVAVWRRSAVRSVTQAAALPRDDAVGVGPAHTAVLDGEALLNDDRLFAPSPRAVHATASMTEQEPNT
jgi:chemotaxis signal transduction protein